MKELQNLAIDDFLQHHWQQKPLLIRQALPGYQSPLSGDELAGLSLEENAESRLIIERQPGQWELLHGPFTEQDFAKLPQNHWTLLVQAVDHWVYDIHALKSFFRFLPDWRLDDVMISYAVTGGSVGPHYDRYDVFLLQASGQRRWHIGQQCNNLSPLAGNSSLNQLKDFDKKESYLLEAGDMLYLPPGCAHWGIAESDGCMTISIGFRAPSYSDIIRRLGDDVADNLSDDLRFRDPHSSFEHPAKISNTAIADIKKLLLETLLTDDNIAAIFGQLVSEPKYPENFIAENNTPHHQLIRRPDARLAYYENGESILLFANGEKLVCDVKNEAFIQYLADTEKPDIGHFSKQQMQLFEKLLALGVYEEAL